MSDAFKPLLAALAGGAVLSDAQAESFFDACLRGELSPAQLGAALTALHLRGETAAEVAAGARALRRSALPFDPGGPVFDTCGTGGDGLHTYNISTAVAFVLAGGGVRVAKHGGRAVSSRSGSAEVLAALGVRLDAPPALARRQLDEAGVCFLSAPAYHPAMRHVAPVRAELGFRTLFNLLGPLANPAGARRQVVGVYDPGRLELVAEVLGALGAEHAWAVHGDGLDELALSGDTQVVEWRDGTLRRFTVTPEAAGMPRAPRGALCGGDPAHNAAALRDLLDGRTGPYRDVVVLNAAAGFHVAGRAADLAEGAALAAAALDDGAARAALARLVELGTEADA